jgi:hypothetical protein
MSVSSDKIRVGLVNPRDAFMFVGVVGTGKFCTATTVLGSGQIPAA